MDRVIYIQFMAGDRLLWYTIGQQDGETDSMRKLDIPQLDYKLKHYSVAVVNSSIYLIGGSKIKSKGYFITPVGRRSTQDLEGYLSLDLLAASPTWVASDGRIAMHYPAALQHSAAVSEHDGSIYTLGGEYGRLVSATPGDVNATWEEIPCFVDVLPQDPRRISKYVRLLALTHNKLFGVTTTNLVCYNLETRNWELIDPHFEGAWHTGIVIEGSYFVSFGMKTPESDAGVYVYDIGRRQWLPEAVGGLGHNDGTVLPEKGLKRGYSFARMWRVGMVDGHPKLALVWSKEVYTTKSCEAHCSKFVLRPQAPHFSAQLLSHRVFSVHDAETTPSLANGAAAMDIGQGKEL